MNLNLKSLISKLNSTCRGALESAAGCCLQRTHYDVDLEHFCLKLIETEQSDFVYLLRHYDVDLRMLSRDLVRILDRFKTGNARTPVLSPRIPKLVCDAWSIASIDFGETSVRSAHLLLALLGVEELAKYVRESSSEWIKVSVDECHRDLANLLAGSPENIQQASGATGGAIVSKESPPKTKAPKIFISYRRDDAGGWAGRLYDKLVQLFGEDNVFMDIDTIAPGIDFVDAIQKSVTACDVLFALIGQRWLTAIDESTGRRRIDIPNDYVRVEISAALKRDVRVVPVLLPKARMPKPNDLPQVLRSLSRRNAFNLGETGFHHDVDRLISFFKT
jgi:hypothetical protein